MTNRTLTIAKINTFLQGRSVVVLSGGISSEREVSLRTGHLVKKALEEASIKSELFDLKDNNIKHLESLVNKAGLVFIALHGGQGEDGTLQACLDFCGIPYTGSSMAVSCVGKDKLLTKKVLKSCGLLVPDYVEFDASDNLITFVETSVRDLGLPLVLKINGEGSGKGVFFAKTRTDLLAKMEEWKDREGIFAEKYIYGRELAVGMVVTDDNVSILPILEAKYAGNIFDYQTKYVNGYTKEVPAVFDALVEGHLIKDAKVAFKSLGVMGYGRLDVRLEIETNKPFFLEVTTLPGMMESSWFPEMAKAGGLKFTDLILAIITAAISRFCGQNKI